MTACGSPRVRTLWSALAHWQARDRRFARLIRLDRGPPLDLLATGTDFQLRRHGEDPRFAASALRVPARVLRDREFLKAEQQRALDVAVGPEANA